MNQKNQEQKVVEMHVTLFLKLEDHVDQQLDVAKVSNKLIVCIFCWYLNNNFFFAADTSAYVEYSSSSDEEEVAVKRGKPAKRRRDESDSGSDVSWDTFYIIIPNMNSNAKYSENSILIFCFVFFRF